MAVREAILKSNDYRNGTKRKMISAMRHISKDPTLKLDVTLLNLQEKEGYSKNGFPDVFQELTKPKEIYAFWLKALNKCHIIIKKFQKTKELKPMQRRNLREFVLFYLVFMNIPRRKKLYLFLRHGQCKNIFETEHNYLDMESKPWRLICNNYKTYQWYKQQVILLEDPANNIYHLPEPSTYKVLNFYKEHIYDHEINVSVFKLKEDPNSSSMTSMLQRITKPEITFNTARKGFATHDEEASERITHVAWSMGHHVKTHMENDMLRDQHRAQMEADGGVL
jgi:hypothetical protein